MNYRFEISGNPITKKNSQRIVTIHGHPCIIPSKQFKDYEAAALEQLDWYADPITVPVEVTCTYYMATNRAVDLTNLMEATHDILVKAHILSDDNSRIIVSVDGSRVLHDKHNPRTEITIKGVRYGQET